MQTSGDARAIPLKCLCQSTRSYWIWWRLLLPTICIHLCIQWSGCTTILCILFAICIRSQKPFVIWHFAYRVVNDFQRIYLHKIRRIRCIRAQFVWFYFLFPLHECLGCCIACADEKNEEMITNQTAKHWSNDGIICFPIFSFFQ